MNFYGISLLDWFSRMAGKQNFYKPTNQLKRCLRKKCLIKKEKWRRKRTDREIDRLKRERRVQIKRDTEITIARERERRRQIDRYRKNRREKEIKREGHIEKERKGGEDIERERMRERCFVYR